MEAERSATIGKGAVTRREAFRAAYDAHVDEVFRYVHRRCRDRALAEDVTHDVFVAAARAIDGPEEMGLAWLRRVARNRLIDVLRREDRHRDRLRLVGVEPDADDHGVLVADRLRVEQALERLSPAHRLVLVLHYLDEMTVQELADELGRSHKGAEALLTRARAALRDELGAIDAG